MGTDLACQYEFPAGQTRTRALSEDRQRLRSQIHVCKSLMRFLQWADSRSSLEIFENMRCGHYNEALLFDDGVCDTDSPASTMYTWEDQLARDENCRKRPAEILPPIRTLVHLQDNDSMLPYSHNVSIHNVPTYFPGQLSESKPLSKHVQTLVISREEDCSRSQQKRLGTEILPRCNTTTKRLRLENWSKQSLADDKVRRTPSSC
jgi:hypothetical protein